ncbi:MAG: WYL domain-containing protein [Luminiphilus sp.]|nr:WYL domain-containing protein [Luminiphilus sp.]
MSEARWEQLLRYRFIEIVALWEGRLTTRHLCDVFGIGRQQASKDINNYKRSVAPGNLEYDSVLKGYLPAPNFTPKVTRGITEEYLEILAGASEIQQVLGGLPGALATTEILQVPRRQVPPEILRPLIKAARGHLRIEVDYVSLNRPDREGRIIVPHTLVWTGLRWHVRAWCEKNGDFRDFVLSRFRGIPELMDSSDHNAKGDSDWQTWIEIILGPDPRLTTEQQDVVAHDYGMTDGRWRLKVRAKLLPYLLKLLQVEAGGNQHDPQAQQVVVLNHAELEQWLFTSN